jgi:hypothetical protein
MGETYSVRVAASIAKRGEGATRRRAGLTFGAEETLVSTDKEREGATHITKKQLRQILDDSNLRAGDTPYPEPGLRVKEVGGDQGPEADSALVEDLRTAAAGVEEGAAASRAEGRQPGRPRKAAKE